MKLIRFLITRKILSLKSAIRFYPIFIMLRLKVIVNNEYTKVNVSIPDKWFLKNNNNSLFGGVLLLVSDPFPALLFEHHFPECTVWTSEHSITYLRPAHGVLNMEVQIDENTILTFKEELISNRSATKTFTYYFKDKNSHKVAEIKSKTYIRKTNKNVADVKG